MGKKKKKNNKIIIKKSYLDTYSIQSGKPKLGGGNADIYFCSYVNDADNYVVLKVLRDPNKEKRRRFLDEVHIMKENYKLIDGILPVFDFSKEDLWYTMPIATSITQYLKENQKNIFQIVDGVLELTETLIKLHEKGISHRDIKPANIYYYDNRYCLGDFGLVDHPGNAHSFTRSDRGLGAIFTIAPEMKRNPKAADGKKADVYSLAKTLWMFLTLDEKGFDGPYDFLDKSYSLRFNSKYKDAHLVELEKLLLSSTMNSPEDRPSMANFKEKLLEWKDISQNEERAQFSDWNFLHEYLFKGTTPESTTWNKVDDIIGILNIIGSIPAYNHMLFSDIGGLDFDTAEKAAEKDCIYIYASRICYIIKPKRLYFGGFDDFAWNYFLLELDELSPVLDVQNTTCEILVEDYPGNYVSAEYAQYGVYDYDKGDKLPEGFKIVYRYLKGKFLIVLKFGPYNNIQSTYDGRHGDCSNDMFREYIEELISIVEKAKEEGYPQEEILNSTYFSKNPFKEKESIIDFTHTKPTKRSSDNFVKENYKYWSFSDIVNTMATPTNNNILFYFEFEGVGSRFSFLEKEGIFLSKDMIIKEISHTNYPEMYTCTSRDVAIEVQQKLNDRIKELCETAGYDYPKFNAAHFSIQLVRVGAPTHLFTKEEIRVLLKGADDRHRNQLVIDENGFAKLLVDSNDGQLYPVRHEIWNAGNIYVGKYSSLNHLDETYISSLEGWLFYLETGRNIYKDYIDNKYPEIELIQRIRAYY